MYFLIGIGIILIFIYGNQLYEYLKERKAKKEYPEDIESELPERTRSADEPTANGEKPMPVISVRQDQMLAEMIAAKLKQKQYVFGVPMVLCENSGDGRLVAMDREDNIYVIETALRPEYSDFYKQVLKDMAVEERRLQKHADERKVYGIVCTHEPSELLKMAVEKEPMLRVFAYDISFVNIC